MTALRRASSAHIAEDAQKRKKRFTASNYHHVIYSLKKKPGALMNLVYRDDLFPGEEYKKHFEFTLSLVEIVRLAGYRQNSLRWRMSKAVKTSIVSQSATLRVSS